MKSFLLSAILLALAAPAVAGEWQTISPASSNQGQDELQVGDHVVCGIKHKQKIRGTVVAILDEKQILFQSDNKYLDPYGTEKENCKKDE